MNWRVAPNEPQIKMKQFIAFVRKEFYHVFRDPKTLLLLFGMPVAQILLFGFALTNEIKDAHIVVCDYSQDAATHRITDQLQAGGNFLIDQQLMSHQEIEKSFKAGNIKLAVVFPSNFEYDLLHEKNAQVQVIADGSDPNTATTLTGYVSNTLMAYQQELMEGQGVPMQVKTEIRMMYNPELKGVFNFVPGVMALVLLLVCVLMTSISIVREKENGTMEVLLVSPFNPFLVVVSKAVPYFVLSLLNLAIILLLSTYLMEMPIKGSIFLLFFASSIMILASLAIGLLISTSTNSQQTAMLISLMGMLLPSMMFTGFMFPIENMPLPLQIISNIVPSKWYYIIIKSVMIKGLGISAIWKEMLILSGMAIFALGLSIKKFKVRLA